MYFWRDDKQGMILQRLCASRAYATAQVRGDRSHSGIRGTVQLYPVDDGTLVTFEFSGLPQMPKQGGSSVLGLHIHSGGRCAGNQQDPFADAEMHFNPENREHPYHAGDLPPVFGNKGYSWGAVYTERFTPQEVLGKTVILHSHPDDFKTQPAGDSGNKIACGVIMR